MGEKGNLLDTTQEVFANLAEQGPQFWVAYEQYKLARNKGDQGAVTAHAAPPAEIYDPAAEETSRPAVG
jgi:hypothetical protein